MTSSTLGANISPVEVTNISIHGFWLFVRTQEFFLPFTDYPWFRNARIDEIQDVQLHHDEHLYWPTLDVDLEVDSLKHPGKYPLVAREHVSVGKTKAGSEFT